MRVHLRHSQNDLNSFDINDMYIDNDTGPFNVTDIGSEPSQEDLDQGHYLVGPDGVYLEGQGMLGSDNDSVQELDLEPSPGPVDPG